MPTQRKLPRSCSRLFLLTVLFYLFSVPAHASFVTSLSATHVQSTLQMHFPIREYTATARITLHDPQVRLVKDAGHITLMIPVEVDVSDGNLRHGHAIVDVDLSYKAITGEVFLHDPHITQFEIPQVSEDMRRDISTTLSAMATNALPLVRIYTVREQDLNHSLDKSALKSVSYEDGALTIDIGFR